MLYNPFGENGTIDISSTLGQEDIIDTSVLVIEPNAALNPLTYCVSNRNFKKTAKKIKSKKQRKKHKNE